MKALTFLYFASDSYESRADVLVKSIEKYHPDAKIVHVKPIADTGIGNYIPGMAKQRLMKALELLESGEPNVVVIGADCELFNRMTQIEILLEIKSIVLVPHTTDPLNNRHFMSQLYVTGHANADLMVFNNDQISKNCLRWLISVTEGHDYSLGIFYEQTWLSAVPFLFSNVYILRDVRYNIGYWDIETRGINYNFDTLYCHDQRAVMVQYSGFIKGKPEKMSKYANKTAHGDVLRLFTEYDERITS